MPTVTLKISDDEKALWVESAQHAGVSLSEWIRCRCQGKAVTPTMGAVVTLTDDDVAALTERESVAEGYATSVLETSRPPTARSVSTDRTKNCLNARHHRKGSFCKLCMTMF